MIITSIKQHLGYGHSTPATQSGRSFCMVYALIGIPLGLVMFQSIGERLNTFVRWLLVIGKKVCKAKNKEVTQTHLVMVITALSIVLMTSMAALFASYERWNYFDALYYCFITLTTIGFGDYVALQKESALQSNPQYVIVSLIFILIGLSVVSSAVNLLVLKFLTLNTEDERRDEEQRYTASLNTIQLDGDVITPGSAATAAAAAATRKQQMQLINSSSDNTADHHQSMQHQDVPNQLIQRRGNDERVINIMSTTKDQLHQQQIQQLALANHFSNNNQQQQHHYNQQQHHSCLISSSQMVNNNKNINNKSSAYATTPPYAGARIGAFASGLPAAPDGCSSSLRTTAGGKPTCQQQHQHHLLQAGNFGARMASSSSSGCGARVLCSPSIPSSINHDASAEFSVRLSSLESPSDQSANNVMLNKVKQRQQVAARRIERQLHDRDIDDDDDDDDGDQDLDNDDDLQVNDDDDRGGDLVNNNNNNKLTATDKLSSQSIHPPLPMSTVDNLHIMDATRGCEDATCSRNYDDMDDDLDQDEDYHHHLQEDNLQRSYCSQRSLKQEYLHYASKNNCAHKQHHRHRHKQHQHRHNHHQHHSLLPPRADQQQLHHHQSHNEIRNVPFSDQCSKQLHNFVGVSNTVDRNASLCTGGRRPTSGQVHKSPSAGHNIPHQHQSSNMGRAQSSEDGEEEDEDDDEAASFITSYTMASGLDGEPEHLDHEQQCRRCNHNRNRNRLHDCPHCCGQGQILRNIVPRNQELPSVYYCGATADDQHHRQEEGIHHKRQHYCDNPNCDQDNQQEYSSALGAGIGVAANRLPDYDASGLGQAHPDKLVSNDESSQADQKQKQQQAVAHANSQLHIHARYHHQHQHHHHQRHQHHRHRHHYRPTPHQQPHDQQHYTGKQQQHHDTYHYNQQQEPPNQQQHPHGQQPSEQPHNQLSHFLSTSQPTVTNVTIAQQQQQHQDHNLEQKRPCSGGAGNCVSLNREQTTQAPSGVGALNPTLVGSCQPNKCNLSLSSDWCQGQQSVGKPDELEPGDRQISDCMEQSSSVVIAMATETGTDLGTGSANNRLLNDQQQQQHHHQNKSSSSSSDDQNDDRRHNHSEQLCRGSSNPSSSISHRCANNETRPMTLGEDDSRCSDQLLQPKE